jgi:hypothetical protein
VAIGVSVTLVFADNEDFHAYSGLSSNVDEHICPEDIKDFIIGDFDAGTA